MVRKPTSELLVWWWNGSMSDKGYVKVASYRLLSSIYCWIDYERSALRIYMRTPYWWKQIKQFEIRGSNQIISIKSKWFYLCVIKNWQKVSLILHTRKQKGNGKTKKHRWAVQKSVKVRLESSGQSGGWHATALIHGEQISNKYGMLISAQKTKVITTTVEVISVEVAGKPLEHVNFLVYLGSAIACDVHIQ